MALPDAVRVFPAHGAGSACGKNLSTERVHHGRATRHQLRLHPDDGRAVPRDGHEEPAAPGYFVHDAVLNRRDHALFDVSNSPKPLTADEFQAARTVGAFVLDTRDAADFSAGHLRGSLNVPADGRFAETAGTVVKPDDRILIIAAQDPDEEIVTRLARLGLDNVTRYLREPEPRS